MSGLELSERPLMESVVENLSAIVTLPRATSVSARPKDELSGTPVNDTIELTGCEPRSWLMLILPKFEKSTWVPLPVIHVSSSAPMVWALAETTVTAANSRVISVLRKLRCMLPPCFALFCSMSTETLYSHMQCKTSPQLRVWPEILAKFHFDTAVDQHDWDRGFTPWNIARRRTARSREAFLLCYPIAAL